MPFEFKSEEELVSFVIGRKLPEWQRKLFEQYASAIQVHSQGQIFYKLDRLFPNEHPQSKDHRILAFESITEASFGRAANNVNRIFKNSSYTVEASEEVVNYTSSHDFDGHNFYSWFLDQWVKYALKEDSNSMIVVYPPEYVREYNRPPVVFTESCFIRNLTSDLFIFVSEEESDIDYQIIEQCVSDEVFYDPKINMNNVREAQKRTYTPKLEATVKRYVYHAFFKDFGFVRLEQQKEGGYLYEEFPIEKEFIPAIDVGGEKGKKNINKSFLHPFVSFGNLALLQHSQHTAVNFTFSFPRMSEIQTPCEANCENGRVSCETDEDKEKFGDWKICEVCNGSGGTVNQTPYKVYRKTYDPQGMEGDQKYLEVDDVKYYTPDTGILNYSKDEWKNYLEMAEVAVYVNQRVATGNVESAKSKEIDREDMHSFLFRVGQAYFNRLRFVLQCIENYLSKNPMEVSVGIPYSYAIVSEEEAFAALKDILSSNVPVMLKASQVESFINKFVSQSSPIRKFIEVLKIVDDLLYYTNSEISGFKASNIVTAEQYATHVFAYPTLQKMYFRDKTLFDQDVEAIATKLTTELVKFKPEPIKDLRERFVTEE